MRFTEKQRLRKDVARLEQQVAWFEEAMDRQSEALDATVADSVRALQALDLAWVEVVTLNAGRKNALTAQADVAKVMDGMKERP
jgi:hypothetical protein